LVPLLSTHMLTKDHLMPLVDAMADRLPCWKSGLMLKVGRTELAKSMAIATMAHITIAVRVSPWINQAINRLRRSFIWTSSDSALGG
jgi:hypothetical protein